MFAVGSADHWCSTADGIESRFWSGYIYPPSGCSCFHWWRLPWACRFMQVSLSLYAHVVIWKFILTSGW